MADNNSPISPLDPLGPEFGRTNLPTIDQQGLSPFEGDRLSMPKINFPEPPSVANPYFNIRQNVVAPSKPVSHEDFKKSIGDMWKQQVAANEDKNQYAKVSSYNAGSSGNNFYKRYLGYGQEKFDKIGFTPLRDNEALYNAKTTGWDDFKRMMTHSFVPLFTAGFVSGPKSLINALQGDFSSDTDDAKIYEEAAAIGSSTKGGVAGFLTNQVMNFGYTAGIITEALVEEGIGLLLAAPTAGASVGVTTANVGRNLFRATKGLDFAVDMAKATKATLKAFDNIGASRNLFKSALNSNIGKFLNPLENTTDALFGLGKATENMQGLAKSYAVLNKTAGGLYRDIRNVNMALSEARLEGGFVENKVYQELYDNHYAETGEAPNNELQKLFMKQAKEAGMTALKYNTALIYGSNKIVLPNIMSPKGGARGLLKSKIDDVLELKTGKIVFEKGASEAGSKLQKGEFKFLEKGLKSTVSSFKKDPLRKSVLGVGGYFKANIAEGLQENAQEVIAAATEQYYVNSFKDKARGAQEYSKALSEYALEETYKQFSAQGFETFASGFTMGLFGKGFDMVLPVMGSAYDKIFDKGRYTKEYAEAKDKIKNGVVAKLNNLYSDPKQFFDSRLFNYGVQSQITKNKEDLDTKQNIDAIEEALISQVVTAIETNTTEYFKDHLSSMKELTPEEFEEAFGYEKGTGEKYLANIDNIISKISEVENNYKKVNERFPNPVDLSQYDPNSNDYKQAAIYSSAWNFAVRNAVFANQSFKDVSARMASITNDILKNTNLTKVTAGDVNVLFDNIRLDSEINLLKNEISSLEESTDPNSKKLLNQKKEKFEALSEFQEALNKYKTIDEDSLASLITAMKERGPEAMEDIAQEIENIKKRNEEPLRKAYIKYLNSIGKSKNEIVLDSDVQTSFEKLKDFYMLDNESQALSRYINLLHSPNDFREHVAKNYEWMSKMYENKKDYYEQIVKDQLDAIENNAILNELAKRNVFVDMEDFENFVANGVLPTEFFDESRKMVIKEGSLEYNEFVSIFIEVALSKQQTGTRDGFDEGLTKELDQLDVEMVEKMVNLPKTIEKTYTEDIKKSALRPITFSKLLKELQDGEYVEAILKDTNETFIFYKDKDVLKKDDIDGEIIEDNAQTKKYRFESAKKFTLEEVADPEQVKAIQEEYAKRKQEVIDKYESKVKEETLETEETEEMDPELEAELKDAFNKMLIEDEDLMNEFEDLSDYDRIQRFEAFVKTSTEANNIIEAYNQKKALQKAVKTSGEVQPFIITVNNKKVSIDTLSDKEIRNYIKLKKARIDTLSSDTSSPEVLAEISALKVELKSAEDYLKYRFSTTDAPEMKATIEKLKKLKDLQKNIEKINGVYYVNNKALKRVTKVVEQLLSKTKSYKDEKQVTISFNQTIGKGLSVSDFIDSLRKKKLSGFSEYTYNELQKELENILSTGILKNISQPKIFNPNTPEIREEDNIIFGAAGKMHKNANRQNQDALFVDKNNGLFIVADGMGGVDKVPFFQPHDAAKLMINQFRGVKEKNPFDIIAEAYKNNNNITTKEVFELLQKNNYIPKTKKFDDSGIIGLADRNIVAINELLRILKDPSSITSNDNWLTRAVGAVGIKAQKIGNNKYEIEHVGDAVFFVIDKNNNIKQVEGLSTSPYVDGFTWGIDTNGEITADPAKKISKYVVELKPGERLVLSSDFIETKAAIEDFINSGLGKNLNFDEFRNKHKNDDASFISIGYEDNNIQKNKTSLNNADLLKRIQQVVYEKTHEESRIAGNYIDEQIKNVFAGKEPEFKENNISTTAFNDMFGEDGYITDIKRRVDNNELYIISTDLLVYDEEAGVAGEIDLILVDRQGKVFIVDMKTGSQSKWENFNNPKSDFSSKEAYTFQQSLYANLLENMLPEIKVSSIGILPIQTDVELETGKILSSKKPSEKILGFNRLTLSLDRNSVQDKVDSVVPRKNIEAETAPVVTPQQIASDQQTAKTPASKPSKFKSKFLISLKQSLSLAKTKEEIKEIEEELNTKIVEDPNQFNIEELNFILEILENKKAALGINTASSKIGTLQVENITEGTVLIATGDFESADGKRSYKANRKYIVESISKTGLSVVNENGNPNFISLSDLKNFIKFEEVNKKDLTPVSMTKEEKELLKESSANTEDFVTNTALLDELEKEARNSSVEDTENDLLNDLTC